jgi:enoyl-CoA hydratase
MMTLCLSGPGKNALSSELMRRVLAEIRAAGDAPLLVRGEGDAFSAGLDLKEIVSLDATGLATFLGTLEEMVEALYDHPGPTVAWVNGHAVAGGCVLALCCDFRVMTARPGPRIGLNEVALGLRFPPRTFAMTRARLAGPTLERILLEASLYDARAAAELGLVHALGEEDEARRVLDRLASHPRDAYAVAKRALRPRLEVAPDDERLFREETVPEWASDRTKAALSAVLRR